MVVLFFFKQKTAYEMRISDGSSDVCSSDLNRTVKNYSEHYSALYQKRLQGMVERRLTQAILAIGSFWFTAWVNAGQPSLQNLEYRALSPEEKQLERSEERRVGKECVSRCESRWSAVH